MQFFADTLIQTTQKIPEYNIVVQYVYLASGHFNDNKNRIICCPTAHTFSNNTTKKEDI